MIARYPTNDATRRILHLRTVTGAGGGPEKTILNSPRYIGPGYEMRLGYFRPRNDPHYDLPERAAALGVHLVDIPESSALDYRALARLDREIRQFRPHVLHAHDYKTNVIAILFGRWHRIPAITTLHGYVTRTTKLNAYYVADRWSLRRMHHVIAVSEDLYGHAIALGVRRERCSIVHNAIDSDAFRPILTRSEAKRRLGVPEDRLLIGAVGRLSPEKGFDSLIRVADRLMGEGRRIELMVAGDGPQRPTLKGLIRQCRFPERFRLLGHCRELLPFYSAMDVFALSSIREGLPNALLEAMAMQVPIVAARISGIPNVVKDGQSGLLVEPSDEAALAVALRRLIDDGCMRERLGAAGRDCMVERFSFTQRMAKVRSVYDRLLARRALKVAG